jgi:ubiquinone/menaquinone biosynthesis C-methylase UbiE
VSDLQHPESRAFEFVADLYERARPEYPAEAVAWIAEQLVLHAGRTVLDLGAGTGKLTRALLATGAHVIAVEPGEAMLAELIRVVPDAEALHGAAEDIPLPDESVDAVAIGQAFHWFRHDEALPELHRVLRPGGGIALVWNARDQDALLQREVSELIEPFVPAGRTAVAPDSSRALSESELFGPLEERRFTFVQELDADGLVGRILSISFVAAAPAEKRAELEQNLRELVAAYGGSVAFPYVTDVYVSRAV